MNTTEKIWIGEYRQRTTHRKKCQSCGKLVQDDETVVFRSVTGIVAGIKGYRTCHVQHVDCAEGWAKVYIEKEKIKMKNWLDLDTYTRKKAKIKNCKGK